MAWNPKHRRALAAVAGTVAAMVVFSACGGSEITAQTPNTAVEAPTGEVTDTGAAPVEGGTTVPGEGAAPEVGAPAPGETGTTPIAPGVDAQKVKGEKVKAPKAGGEVAKPTEPGAKGGPDKAGAVAVPAVEAGAVAQLVATAPIFGGSGTCKPATGSEVNIGNVSTLSGVLGELFSPVRPALETFVASQNACGGLNGHKIKFFIDDDQGDPATAVSKIQNMIQNNKVLAFVGNIQVLTVDAIVPTIKKAGIPIVGGDLTNNTWFTNPLFFPQGSPPQAVAYGYHIGARDYFKKTNLGNVWCIEVPRACEQINRAFKELAPELGTTVKKDIQVSITAPSYVQQCLDFKNSGVEVLALTFDAASQNRLARSCEQVGYFPKVLPYPLGVGNEKQFLGNKWLGDAYVTMNHFPWMGNSTPAEKYWQASIKKFNPGFTSGGAASLGWGAGALLVAASANLSENPTTQELLDTLYTFKGQEFTEIGGLAGPLTFNEGANPTIPYCLFAAISNAANTGWAKVVSKPVCTKTIAPSDPQLNS